MKGDGNMNDIIDNMKCESEPIPQILEDFCKNVPGAQFDNLYLCQSVDMDGNIVDTKIGRNLMTNNGLSKIFIEHNPSYQSKYLYLGNGKSQPDPESLTLESYITALGQCTQESSSTSRYPSKFDPSTNIFSVKCKVYQGYWNYTSGNNEDYEISEIGYGPSYNNLYTHALIYDEYGKQTSIHKKPNTRLYITLYWTVSLNVKCIKEAYENKQYALIDPRIAFYTGYGPSVYLQPVARQNISSYGDMNISSGSNFSKGDYYLTSTLDSSKRIAYSLNLLSTLSWTWEAPYMYLSGMLVGPLWYMSDQSSLASAGTFAILTYDELPEPEYLECEDVYVDNIAVINSGGYNANNINSSSILTLTETFGSKLSCYPIADCDWTTPEGTIPAVQYNMQTLCMYNYKSKNWDIDVPFENAEDTYYNYAHWRLYLDLWTTYNGTSRNVYVHVNAYPEYPIIGFNNSSMTICATDEYWDPSTYQQIANLTSVEKELQSKRYYIIVSGTNAILNPIYDSDVRKIHKLKLERNPFEITGVPIVPGTNRAGQGGSGLGSRPISSDKFGYFLIDAYLVYLDIDTKAVTYHEIKMNNDTYGCFHRRYVTKNEDRILIFKSYTSYLFGRDDYSSRTTNGYTAAKNSFRIFEVGDKDTEIKTKDMDLSFSTPVAGSDTYHNYSWAENGFLVAQRTEGVDEAVFVDVYNEEQHLISNCKHCYALNLTDNCVYQDTSIATSDTGFTIRIYDMKNKEIIDTLEIDEGVNYTVTGIYGWREFVYVLVSLNSVTTTFFYNTKTKAMEHISTAAYTRFNTGYGWNLLSTESVDECMVSCVSNTSSTVIYKADDPTNPITLMSDNLRTKYDWQYGRLGEYGQKPQIKRINDDKQLLLSFMSAYYSRVVDLGYILDNGSIDRFPYTQFPELSGGSSYRDGSIYIFKNGVILQDGYSSNNRMGHMYWVPIECYLRLKTTGTTKTITCYNNPLTFGGKGYNFAITNNMDLILNPDSAGR